MAATPPNSSGTKSGRLERILNTQSDKSQAFSARRTVGAVPVELPELLAEALARHPVSMEGMPTASKRSALAAAVWIAAMMPRHSRPGEVVAVLSQRTVQAMMRVGSSTLSLAVWALRDPQVAELLGWEWHPRKEGQAWTVTITGWDLADRRQYLQIPTTGATAPWEVLFFACMSLHAERGRRVLIPARRVWEQTQHLHQVSHHTWKRWTTKAREASWADQPRRSCWTLAPERMPPTAQRQFLWAETRRRAEACGTPINRGVPPKCTHLASASNSLSPRPPPKSHHRVNPEWRTLLAEGEGLSPNTARRSGPSSEVSTIEGLAWAVLDRCTSPPTGKWLAGWLYSLLWAADTTTRRPAEATWPIIDQVRYCAALARRFAADQPRGELSGAIRAVAIGRWPPTEHGAWLTRCQRLARAIITGQGVSAASREWWKHLQDLADRPLVQIDDREHQSTGSEFLSPQNRAMRPRSELTRACGDQTPAGGETLTRFGRRRPGRLERPPGGPYSPANGQGHPEDTKVLRPPRATSAPVGAVERAPHPKRSDQDHPIRRKIQAWLEELEAAGHPLPSTQTVREYVEALRRQARNN